MKTTLPLMMPVVILFTMFLSSPAIAQQNVVVVLDDSGSMQDSMNGNRRVSKMNAARSALTQVLENLPDDANVGVLALNSGGGTGNWIATLGPVDRGSIASQIALINASGGTPLGSAMQIAADALIEARRRQVYGTYRMLIVTDGEASDPHLVDRFLPLAQSRGLLVDVIGVSMPGDHSLATQVQSYRRADDPNSLTGAVADVFAETSDTSDDSIDSDYDLIAGLADEVAAGALETIAMPNNMLLADSPPQSFPNPSYNTSSPHNSSTPQPAVAVDGGVSGFFCCAMSLGLLVLFPVVLLRLGGVKTPSDRSRYQK